MKALVKLGISILATSAASVGAATITTKVVEYHQYNQVHEIVTSDVYTINGEEVTAEEWSSYKDLLDGEGNVIPNLPHESQVVYADHSDAFYAMISTPHTHFDYLAVWNISEDIFTPKNKSNVQPYFDKAERPQQAEKLIDYMNYSCFNYKAEEDYSQYAEELTKRAAPGRYLDPETGVEGDWKNACDGVGLYILKNADVQSFTISNKAKHNDIPLSQVIITYEAAYSQYQMK